MNTTEFTISSPANLSQLESSCSTPTDIFSSDSLTDTSSSITTELSELSELSDTSELTDSSELTDLSELSDITDVTNNTDSTDTSRVSSLESASVNSMTTNVSTSLLQSPDTTYMPCQVTKRSAQSGSKKVSQTKTIRGTSKKPLSRDFNNIPRTSGHKRAHQDTPHFNNHIRKIILTKEKPTSCPLILDDTYYGEPTIKHIILDDDGTPLQTYLSNDIPNLCTQNMNDTTTNNIPYHNSHLMDKYVSELNLPYDKEVKIVDTSNPTFSHLRLFENPNIIRVGKDKYYCTKHCILLLHPDCLRCVKKEFLPSREMPDPNDYSVSSNNIFMEYKKFLHQSYKLKLTQDPTHKQHIGSVGYNDANGYPIYNILCNYQDSLYNPHNIGYSDLPEHIGFPNHTNHMERIVIDPQDLVEPVEDTLDDSNDINDTQSLNNPRYSLGNTVTGTSMISGYSITREQDKQSRTALETRLEAEKLTKALHTSSHLKPQKDDDTRLSVRFKTDCWYCDDHIDMKNKHAVKDQFCSQACLYLYRNNTSYDLVFNAYYFPPFSVLSLETKQWYYLHKHSIKYGIYYNTDTYDIFVDNVPMNQKLKWKRSSKLCLLCHRPGVKDYLYVNRDHMLSEGEAKGSRDIKVGYVCDDICKQILFDDARHYLTPPLISAYKIPYHSSLTVENIAACVNFLKSNVKVNGFVYIKDMDKVGCTLVQKFYHNNYFAYIHEIITQLKQEKEQLEQYTKQMAIRGKKVVTRMEQPCVHKPVNNTETPKDVICEKPRFKIIERDGKRIKVVSKADKERYRLSKEMLKSSATSNLTNSNNDDTSTADNDSNNTHDTPTESSTNTLGMSITESLQISSFNQNDLLDNSEDNGAIVDNNIAGMFANISATHRDYDKNSICMTVDE